MVKHERIPGGELLPSRNDTVKTGNSTVFHERGDLAFGGVRLLGKTEFKSNKFAERRGDCPVDHKPLENRSWE